MGSPSSDGCTLKRGNATIGRHRPKQTTKYDTWPCIRVAAHRQANDRLVTGREAADTHTNPQTQEKKKQCRKSALSPSTKLQTTYCKYGNKTQVVVERSWSPCKEPTVTASISGTAVPSYSVPVQLVTRRRNNKHVWRGELIRKRLKITTQLFCKPSPHARTGIYLVELLVEAEPDDDPEAPHPEHRILEVENLPRSLRRVGLGTCQPTIYRKKIPM